MIDRHQRRALPTRAHIGAAQIGDHGNAERAGQHRAVTNLPGPAPLGPVGNGMAMKADHPDILRHMAAAAQHVGNRIDVEIGKVHLHRADQRILARRVHRHRPRAGGG